MNVTTEYDILMIRVERAQQALEAYCAEAESVMPTDPQAQVDLVSKLVSDLGHWLDQRTAEPGVIVEAAEAGITTLYEAEVADRVMEAEAKDEIDRLLGGGDVS